MYFQIWTKIYKCSSNILNQTQFCNHDAFDLIHVWWQSIPYQYYQSIYQVNIIQIPTVMNLCGSCNVSCNKSTQLTHKWVNTKYDTKIIPNEPTDHIVTTSRVLRDRSYTTKINKDRITQAKTVVTIPPSQISYTHSIFQQTQVLQWKMLGWIVQEPFSDNVKRQKCDRSS